MTSNYPTQWTNWIALAEWWSNSNYHPSLMMTPFKALYGYPPPHLAFPSQVTTSVKSVEDYLKDKDHMLQLLKEDLSRAQDRMKLFADQKRTDKIFQVGDLVFLNLHPYRQTSVTLRKNLKLSSRYFDPFEILQKVGPVAYMLKLPLCSRIHPVFHVSQLKQKIGSKYLTADSLPQVDTTGMFIVIPIAVLGTRITLRDNQHVSQVLIQWSGLSPEDTSWQDCSHIRSQFPKFILEDKDLSKGGVLS